MNTLSTELNNLNASSSDIIGSGLASICGMSLAAALPEHLHEDWVATMSAAVLSLGMHAAGKLALSDMEQVLIKGRQGCALTLPVAEEVVLTVMAKPGIDLGKLISVTEQAARNLAELLKAPDADTMTASVTHYNRSQAEDAPAQTALAA